MKWVKILSSAKREVYELCHGEKKLLSLTYSKDAGSARVQSDGEKRTFLIGKEGFLKRKTVLRNEYGFKMGHLEYEKYNAVEGIIDLLGERFHYIIQNDPVAKLIIYQSAKDHPLVTCGLTASSGNTGMHLKKEDDLHHTSYPCLLMALCWYLFLPVAKDNIIEHAV